MPSTIQRACQLFVQQISPTSDHFERASKSQSYIRQVLAHKHGQDSSFPKIEREFLLGSAARRTKLLPLDAVDL